MPDKPGTTYIVSVFEKRHWRTVLTTRDPEEAVSLEWAMIQDGVKARIEEITPKPQRSTKGPDAVGDISDDRWVNSEGRGLRV